MYVTANNSNNLLCMFCGYKLKTLGSGDSNVAVGSFALENNTSGVANVAIGSWDSSTYQAPLTTNTVGSFNIAIGSGVLRLANEKSSFKVPPEQECALDMID